MVLVSEHNPRIVFYLLKDLLTFFTWTHLQQPQWSGQQQHHQRQPYGNVLDQFNSKSMSQSWTGHTSQKSGGKGLAAALKAAHSALQTHGLMDDHHIPSDSSINRQVRGACTW